MASEAQINANRENSKFSQGPVTAEGKSTCSKNALKHALTGRTVLLRADDLTAYENLCAILDQKFAPESDAEKLLVESIAETEWRLTRINVIHSGIFALGRLQHKDDFADEADLAPAERAAIIETLIFKENQKELNNLAMLQGRLQRHLERRTKEFEQLRTERETVQLIRRKVAMETLKGGGTLPGFNVGSEFSKEYLLHRLEFSFHSGKEKQADLVLFDRSWRDKLANRPN